MKDKTTNANNTAPIYKCAFCGKRYKSAVDRANCEIECDKQIKKRTQEEKEKKLLAEKEARLKEVNEAYNHYVELKKQFNKDYNGIKGLSDYDIINLLFTIS